MRTSCLFIASILQLYLAGQIIDNTRFSLGVKLNPQIPDSIFFHGQYDLSFLENEARFESKQGTPFSFNPFSTTVTDSDGNLLFYTNGRSLADASDQIVPNASDLWWNSAPGENGTGSETWALPVSDSIYYLVSEFYSFGNSGCQYCTDYFYHKIKVSPINKKITLLEKDKLFFSKAGNNIFQPIRHANGKDWFIVISHGEYDPFTWEDAKYGTWLLNEKSIQQVSSINTQISNLTGGSFGRQKGFSHDGSKAFWFEPRVGIILFDFDRCTGKLSNETYVARNVQPAEYGGGAAFSPNNRFFYTSTHWAIDPNVSSPVTGLLLQYDLQKPDFGNHPDTIAIADTLPNHPETFFYYPGQVFDYLFYGIDGRLYHKSGIDHYSYIEFPDSAGKACGYRSRGMPTPRFVYTTPSVVNYRLGPIDGSPCDTLGINNNPQADFRYKKRDSLTVWFRDLSWHEPQTWLWDFGDGSSKSTEQFPTHHFPTFGKYLVCLTVSNQFGEDTFCREVDLNGSVSATSNGRNSEKLTIFPNPTNGPFHLYFVEPLQIENRLSIFDISGKLVFSSTIKKGLIAANFDLSFLNNGLYFWQLSTDSGPLANGKIIKMDR